LFETIRLQNGVLQNLGYHNSRLNYSRKQLFDISEIINLQDLIQTPSCHRKGIFKCKVIYGLTLEEITIEPYEPRIIKSLRLIEDNSISYSYKYTDRDQLNELFTRKGDFDEILIVKNGFITDTSFSNIIFSDGNQWFTPLNPLLRGTMQSFLVEKNFISEKEIKIADLKQFTRARLINAMRPFDPGKDIPIEKINF